MSMRVDAQTEDELRTAFRAAAGNVHPQGQALPSAADRGTRSSRRSRGGRWLVPAVAAAVAAAIGVPVLVLSALGGPGGPDIAAASAVSVSGNRATVAGISFPVPDEWTAKTVATSSTSVTVCIAASPAADCAGVALRIAVPNGDGHITPVPDPITLAKPRCPGDGKHAAGLYPQLIDQTPLDGRPAGHYAIACGPSGPQSAGWYITDGSLSITTPPGLAIQQATQVAAGLSFSGYRHSYGPQIGFYVSVSRSSVTNSH